MRLTLYFFYNIIIILSAAHLISFLFFLASTGSLLLLSCPGTGIAYENNTIVRLQS